jgi:eukaryotic-like serine/threonine-protein kinase
MAESHRWRRAQDLFELALRRSGSDRDSFLSESCLGDRELLSEVEALLAASDASRTPLPSGTRLGPYEIVALIDAGGMGEVYKGRDTRLNRTVAIKTLRAHHSDDPERRRCFEREAQAIGALAHPHICVLYDVGQHDGIDFLVIEHLEGETLAKRSLKRPLPIDEVLRYAIEVAMRSTRPIAKASSTAT